VKDVYSVEIHKKLGERAAGVHKELGYTNIHTRVGDGYEGWPEAAPFDAIIVTCAPHRIPQPLIDQLKEGGRMVIPLGGRFTQSVHLVIKRDGKLIDKVLKPTLFVPMTGKALKEKLSAIEGELFQVKAKDQLNMLDYPMRLAAKFVALSGVVASADAAPTRQARQVFEELSLYLAGQLQRLSELINTDVAAFNKLIREASVPAIVPAALLHEAAKQNRSD
jgi:hypothetical protein